MANKGNIIVQLTSNKGEILQLTDEAIARALEAVGLQAEGYAKLKCPVDTGRLRNSITHTQADKLTEIIGTNVEYAAYVELGTIRQKAKPYLKPALLNHINEYQEMLKYYLENG